MPRQRIDGVVKATSKKAFPHCRFGNAPFDLPMKADKRTLNKRRSYMSIATTATPDNRIDLTGSTSKRLNAALWIVQSASGSANNASISFSMFFHLAARFQGS